MGGRSFPFPAGLTPTYQNPSSPAYYLRVLPAHARCARYNSSSPPHFLRKTFCIPFLPVLQSPGGEDGTRLRSSEAGQPLLPKSPPPHSPCSPPPKASPSMKPPLSSATPPPPSAASSPPASSSRGNPAALAPANTSLTKFPSRAGRLNPYAAHAKRPPQLRPLSSRANSPWCGKNKKPRLSAPARFLHSKKMLRYYPKNSKRAIMPTNIEIIIEITVICMKIRAHRIS